MMNLTAAMTNLSSEIGALRQARETFMENLRKETGEMLANFTFARTQMALKTKSDLAAFVSNLKRRVGRFRDEFRTDLAGTHRAWFGHTARRAMEPEGQRPIKAEKRTKRL